MFSASVTIAAGSASLALTTKSRVICGFAPWVWKSPVYTTVPLRGVDCKAVCARHGVVYVNRLDLQVADFQFLSRLNDLKGMSLTRNSRSVLRRLELVEWFVLFRRSRLGFGDL